MRKYLHPLSSSQIVEAAFQYSDKNCLGVGVSLMLASARAHPVLTMSCLNSTLDILHAMREFGVEYLGQSPFWQDIDDVGYLHKLSYSYNKLKDEFYYQSDTL